MDRTYTENFLMFSVLHRWVNESRSVMSDSLWPHGLYSPCNSPGQNTGVVAFSFSKGSSQPRDWTQVSRTAGGGGLFINWALWEALVLVKNLSANAENLRDEGSNPGQEDTLRIRKIPQRRTWQPTLVLLPGESHGQRSLAGYCPYRCKE